LKSRSPSLLDLSWLLRAAEAGGGGDVGLVMATSSCSSFAGCVWDFDPRLSIDRDGISATRRKCRSPRVHVKGFEELPLLRFPRRLSQ